MGAGRPARLAVGVVSAGRVGRSWAPRWPRAGPPRSSPPPASPGPRVSRGRRCCPAFRSSRPTRSPSAPTSSLLAVPDDVLPGLVRGLAAAGASAPARSSCTPPARTASRCWTRRRAGALPLALHPVDDLHRPRRGRRAARRGQRRRSPPRPRTRPRGASARRWSWRWAPSRSGCPRSVRPLYHAALAHGANHLITLVRDCADLLERAGVHPAERLRRAAAVRRARQRAAPRRPGAHRARRPRRRRHRPHPPARARRSRPRPGRDLPGPGRPHRPPRPPRRLLPDHAADEVLAPSTAEGALT